MPDTPSAPLIRATDGLQLAAVASSDPQKVHAALGLDIAVMAAAELVRCDDLDLVVDRDTERPAPSAGAAALAPRAPCGDSTSRSRWTAAQAEELVAEAERGGRLLSVFHNRPGTATS